MVDRILAQKLEEYINYYPIITVTGPRQSGKTTLIKKIFSNMKYYTLENPDIRQRAIDDPKLFLNSAKHLILDEIQRVPELFSYIQGIVDEDDSRKFILSGSQNFLLLEKISQTLAGRTALFKLLPFSLQEIAPIVKYNDAFDYVFKGFYPRLYDKKIPVSKFYQDYISTYIERDVRTIINVSSLYKFQVFLQLCASRVGQLLNISSLASDAGITTKTAQKWLSILETSYIIYSLKPYYKNYKKRLVKSHKFYFYDTGLACSLLNIKSKEELIIHYAKGSLFENFIINEIIKNKTNKATPQNLFFWRNKEGRELDCIIDDSPVFIPIEIKSSSTYHKDYFKNLSYFTKISDSNSKNNYLIYSGNESFKTNLGNVLSWKELNILA